MIERGRKAPHCYALTIVHKYDGIKQRAIRIFIALELGSLYAQLVSSPSQGAQKMFRLNHNFL